MKNNPLSIVLFLAIMSSIVLLCAGCGCDHEWLDATCTDPMICKVCNETQGEIVDHVWESATCDKPEVCSMCGESRGEALGHEWEDATCVKPQICSICSKSQGESLGHAEGECVVVKEATIDGIGEEQVSCTRCGEVLETNPLYYYEITEEEITLYTNVLDMYNSLKTIHINPDSFKLLGAVVNTNTSRTTIYLSFAGYDGNTHTDYFWKDIGTNRTTIKNVFGRDNYIGSASPVEELDLNEIMYFEMYGEYKPTISPISDIIVS